VPQKEERASEPIEDLPPTLTIFDNQMPEKDWSAQLVAPEMQKSPDSKTADNIPMKTESVDLSPFEVDTLKSEKTAEPSVAKVEQSPLENNEVESKVVSEVPAKQEFVENKPEDLAQAETIKEEIKPTDFGFPNANSETLIQKPSVALEMPVEEDFQSTIPYSPKDFAKQEITSAKTAAKPEAAKPVEPVVNPIKESREAIVKPEIPVGSSSHDSLEPKLVSVQIYNPADQANAEKSLSDDLSAREESIHDSQTLLKQPPQQKTEAKESRSYTSPNMGNDDTDGRSKAKLKPLDEGTVLNGRYEIVRKIGGGGMGAVYLASDRNLGGVLRAVKEMVQSYIEDAQQEKAINDFKRESLLLTSLEHPTIPTIYDYFYDEKEGRFYLVMKYISGGDLSGRMRSMPEGRLDEATVTDWAIQIADVLDYLHNRQPPIVYRDLKPSNIMIDGNSGRVMLIDFGIARWVNKEEKGVTAVGTMGYAPPELFSGNVEPRSDIYSLGSTLFHLLTGADPQSNPLLIFDFHKNPRPRQINSGLSDQIEKILMKMVEYSADKRFANAAELRETLIKHRENLQKGSVTFGAGSATEQSAPELVFCGFCGQKIVGSDVFCPFCGAQQPLAGQSKAAPVFAAPKMTARLMIIGTNELDAPVFNLEKDTNLVGRRDPMSNIFPEVDLSKFDPQTKISRKHARIWRESDSFMVEDLGSSNGTILINRLNEPMRLGKNQPQLLSNGDKIRVGDTTLHFIVG
jgi:serine/threonine-protein kinase